MTDAYDAKSIEHQYKKVEMLVEMLFVEKDVRDTLNRELNQRLAFLSTENAGLKQQNEDLKHRVLTLESKFLYNIMCCWV
jgi:chaperonin cofactor prefoldin